MIYLLPWAVPAFITIMFFSIMFSTQGALTEVVQNVFGVAIDFKNSTFWSRFILVMLQGWLGSSYVFLLSTGVLQAIPEDLYEAADIDGANTWQQFWAITLPLLTPTIFFNLVLSIIGTAQTFTQAFVATNGGPLNATLFYVLYLYRQAFQMFRMGYASALAWALFVIVMVLTLLVVRSGRSWVYYEISDER